MPDDIRPETKAPNHLVGQVLESRSIFEGHAIDLRVDQVRLPNGYEGQLEIVAHPGAAAVVPVTAEGLVVLVRQYRHAAGGWLLEVPAGKLDPGEAPEACARRETAEEVGRRPGRLESLGSIFPTPGFADERIWLFLGTELEIVETAHEVDEVLEIVTMPLETAVDLALAVAHDPVASANGEEPGMPDAKSAIAILRAAHRLAGR